MLSANHPAVPELALAAQRVTPLGIAKGQRFSLFTRWRALSGRVLLETLCDNGDSRNHLLELVHRRLDVSARCDIVLDLVDERRVRYASRVGGRIFAGGRSFD